MLIEQPHEPQVDITQRATNPNPTTFPQKDPKRVAAGKTSAERRRQTREAQNKALEDAIKENNKLKARKEPGVSPSGSTLGSTSYQRAEPSEEPATQTHSSSSNSGLGRAGWLTIAGIAASLFTSYLKREDLKDVKNYFAGGRKGKDNVPKAPPGG